MADLPSPQAMPSADGGTLTARQARFVLVLAAALWGGSYATAKIAMQAVGVQWLLACRLLLAAAFTYAIFHRRIRSWLTRRFIIPALVVGFTYYACFLLQMIGLTTIESGRSAFLTAAYCVIVPFVSWIATRQRPRPQHLIGAAACLAGVGFVSMSSGLGTFAIAAGDWLTLACAAIYAVCLVALGIYGQRIDPIALTFGEFLVSGACCLVGAAFTEPLPHPTHLDLTTIASLVYLLFGATIGAQGLQNLALPRVPATQSSIILCLESVFSLLVAVLLMGEQVTLTAGIGFALVFGAILISQIPSSHSAD